MNKKILSAVICLCLVLGNISVYAQTEPQNNACKGGMAIAFLNGVANTEKDAKESLRQLKHFYGENTKDGEKIRYELLYNETIGFFEDVMEVFHQKKAAMGEEARKIYEERYELFWDMLNNGSWSQILFDTEEASKNMMTALLNDYMAHIELAISSMFNNSPTEINYIEHRTRIDNWILEGNKLLFVAHSQGNLFANAAYDYAVAKSDKILLGQYT